MKKLYSTEVVDTINNLHLARYGLGNYLNPDSSRVPSKEEERIITNLSRAGKRLMGFCRATYLNALKVVVPLSSFL